MHHVTELTMQRTIDELETRVQWFHALVPPPTSRQLLVLTRLVYSGDVTTLQRRLFPFLAEYRIAGSKRVDQVGSHRSTAPSALQTSSFARRSGFVWGCDCESTAQQRNVFYLC